MSRRDEILDVAARLLEEDGLDAVTMREVAVRMGIRAPSLYKHVRDKDDVVAGLQERALVGIGRHLELSGRFPPGADLDATWRTALSGCRVSSAHIRRVPTRRSTADPLPRLPAHRETRGGGEAR